MAATALVLLDVTLADPAADEDAFLAWFAEAETLLRARARLDRATLAVQVRGRYLMSLELALPGTWTVVSADRPWRELEARRPRAEVQVRELRMWHRDGVRDVTTSELARWLGERDAGTRDLVLLDALPREKFLEKHLPGAVSLPAASVDETSAAAAIGPAQDRPVVIYCAHYG